MRPYKAARTRPLPFPRTDHDTALLRTAAQPAGPVRPVGSSGFAPSGAPEHRLSHHPSLMPLNHRPTAPRGPNSYHRPFPIQMTGVPIQLTEDAFSLTAAGEWGYFMLREYDVIALIPLSRAGVVISRYCAPARARPRCCRSTRPPSGGCCPPPGRRRPRCLLPLPSSSGLPCGTFAQRFQRLNRPGFNG